MRTAFKEWAIIVDALASGEQIIILRKGGILEGRDGFRVEHDRFLLFPTLFHQQRESVIPKAQMRYDAVSSTFPNASCVRLSHFAEVVEWKRLESLEAAERLRGQHLWRDEVIAQRFDWGKEKNIHALALRVFRLPHAIEFPMQPSYAGCKSWIDLDFEVDTDGSIPVLDAQAFAHKLDQFRSALTPVADPR